MIAFSSVVERTELVDPGGQRAEQAIEHRFDPLTGAVSSVNAALGEKAKAFLGSADVDLLRDLEQRSRGTCPFCHAAARGTRFTPDVAPEGQLRLGGALAMPNLFSKCRLDAVVVLDEAEHVLFPSRVGAGAFANGIRLAAELVRRARAGEPAA